MAAVDADWTAGVTLLLTELRKGMLLDPMQEQGTELKRFFRDNALDRRTSEAIPDFLVRFRESVTRLEEKGLLVPKAEGIHILGSHGSPLGSQGEEGDL